MKLLNLSVLAYARGFSLWSYKAGDATLASVEAPGFFSGAACMFEAGDLIVIAAADGTRIRAISLAGGEVELAALS